MSRAGSGEGGLGPPGRTPGAESERERFCVEGVSDPLTGDAGRAGEMGLDTDIDCVGDKGRDEDMGRDGDIGRPGDVGREGLVGRLKARNDGGGGSSA